MIGLNWLKRRIAWLNCREMTQLSTKNQNVKLTLIERTALVFHYCICSFCRRFEADMKRLRIRIRRDIARGESSTSETMSNEAKQRIKERLQD